MAVYNAASYLKEALNSLSQQTEGDFQAICIDDGSTDSSAEILQQHAAADPRFEIIRLSQNSGQAVARNTGLAHARGELTLFLDADDTLAEDALQQIWEAYCNTPEADCVVMRLIRTWEDGRQEEWFTPTTTRIISGREAALMSIDLSLHGIYAIKTEIHRRYPYSETLRQYSDDNTTRLHYLYSRRVVLSNATYYYRQHPSSCTHAVDLRRLDYLEANRELRRLLEEHQVGTNGLCRCEHFCWYNLVALYREMLISRRNFSAAEWKEAIHRFRRAYSDIRPARLSLRILCHPSTIYIWPFPFFRLWAYVIWTATKLVRSSK